MDYVRLNPLKFLLVLFVISVALNYIWELVQAPLFVGMDSVGALAWHCFVASLGDGIILWIIYGLGWGAFGHWRWTYQPGFRQMAFMLSVSIVIAILIEWSALHWLKRWSYTDSMPLIPVLDVGLTPILQMLILPPFIFFLTHKLLPLHEGSTPRR